VGFAGTVGVGLDGRLGLPFPELREAGAIAADLGFASAWTPAGGLPDAFHVCAHWSVAAGRGLRTGISVVAAPTWTVPTLAAQAATVGQIAGGTFSLGIGTGGYGAEAWAAHGLPDKPVAIMREHLVALRGLLAGEEVSLDGMAVHLRRARLGGVVEEGVPVQLAALGPQMLRLAGEASDGALLNWATPGQIARSRELVGEGAARAGRDPSAVPLIMYIRVCIDDDLAAARRALGTQVLSYAMGRRGVPNTLGYRGHFGRMGFEDVLTELESRREGGAGLPELVDAAPDELLSAVGYWGSAGGAPSAFGRLADGLDEALVRVVSARPGLGPVVEAMEALTPERIENAD
jgi:alkanesulfonate monooxygenase SsuD/methylene tetrahydromethanopterin reductase-like flavin-dependent oxidoreductase (luciferase family)